MQTVIGPVIFVPIFAAWFCFVCLLLSRIGGWAALARRYRATAAPEGRLFSFQSGHIGTVRYNSSLDVWVSANGLYVRVFPLFRVGHPPLFIPWSELHGLHEKKVLFWTFVEMEVGKPSITTLTIPMHLVESLRVAEKTGPK